MIKALIFDFDGTILDTETAWYEAFREAYEQHGVDFPLEKYAECIGTNNHTFNPYEYLMTDLGLPIDREDFKSSIHQRYSELMKKESLRPGIMEYLQAAKEHGLRIGLASSSDKKWIDNHLQQLGIASYFECIRTSDDVKLVKPDPELYVQTLECLNVKPEEAIAIEDSPNGAKAAFAAGMHYVVVPNQITRFLKFDGNPLYHENSLNDIDFNELIFHPKVSK